jgi:cobalt/nickel transport system permease protein
MHMADALLSPAVGGTMWAASAGMIGFCSRKVRRELDDHKIPLMGVLGAFIFAAQMINFTIPGTGSSGHLGGGMILAILLGPYAAFLVMASVLIVQSLFFADGGLLALGCNIFNLGVFACFIAYPLVYKPLAGLRPGVIRLWLGSILAAVFGLQLGALGVVMETSLSGIAELPFATFALMMQPIHLAIGLVEGIVTASVVSFVWNSRPEILSAAAEGQAIGKTSIRPVLAGLFLAALVIGGGLSWFASSHPDGLEWAMFKTSGSEELESPEHGIHETLFAVQEKTALLPDYNFPESQESAGSAAHAGSIVDTGTSFSGIVGGLVTLLITGLIGWLLRIRQHKKPA